jgi:hypothetical protein
VKVRLRCFQTDVDAAVFRKHDSYKGSACNMSKSMSILSVAFASTARVLASVGKPPAHIEG